MYSDPPLQYRPAPVSVIAKRARSKARRHFTQWLAGDPVRAMAYANDKLGEASRQEENRHTFFEGSL